MPTYEYRCTACEAPLEVVQSFDEPALTECPTCGGRLRKVFGNVGVVFKGSGFYRTDSRGKTTAAVADGAKSDGPAKADGVSGDAKPAAAATGSGSSSEGGSAAKPGAAKPGAAKPSPAKAASPSAASS
jgi:putative FmdB family regulatory protein